MAVNLTTIDQLVKTLYMPGLADAVNSERPLLQRIEKIRDRKRYSGKELRFGIKLENTQGAGPIGESEVLPTPGAVITKQMTIAMKYYYAAVNFSEQAVAFTDDAGGIASALKTELDSARDIVGEIRAGDFISGDGSGAIARVASYAGTTLTLQNQPTIGTFGTRLLHEGMTVSSYAAKSGGAVNASHVTLGTVLGESTVTVPAGGAWQAGDYVFRSVTSGVDPRNKSAMGLAGIVDDGTRVGTFQGLSRTTYPKLKANLLRNGGTLRALTPDLLDTLVTRSFQVGGGKPPTALISQWELQQRAASIARADQRYDMGTSEIEGGYTSVTWRSPVGKFPWITDRFAVPNEVMAVREPDLFMAEHTPLQIRERDGRMFRHVDRTDTFEAWMVNWVNLGARLCNNHSSLADVSNTL